MNQEDLTGGLVDSIRKTMKRNKREFDPFPPMIDVLMSNKEWEKSMRDMMVDGTAHPDPNSGPPGPFVAPSSHFGGEIGGKIPFEGLGGLKRKESGFRPKSKSWPPRCYDPSHNPPMHLYIPPDQEYVHVCHSCGNTIVIGGQEISF